MTLSPDARRRWFGGVCVGISAVMLVLGLTVLKHRLRLQTFLYYWLLCMMVTALALVFALLDLLAVRLRSRREHAELLNRTLLEIERSKQERAARKKQNPQT